MCCARPSWRSHCAWASTRDAVVFAPSSRDGLHRLALEDEPGLALFWLVCQRVLEAAEGLALLQRLPEDPGEPGIAALIDEVLHGAEGVRRLDRRDAQPSLVVARILGDFVQRIRFGHEQQLTGFEVQPVAALSERVTRVQGAAEFVQVDVQRAGCGAAVTFMAIGWIHLEIPSASHRNW